MQQAATCHTLTPSLRTKLVSLANQYGLRRLAVRIGVSPQTLATVAAGINANSSTVALIRLRLAELGVDPPKA